ncbi:Uu.00g029140.m01.CDS01 [Anthostomella pinea]|uniref:Uu.00g029140.m01.CDS01 n=1 Tax=Anthostomella pinea TaxID=933095 RepID=A0AAI8V826_9PEZI|nr:Uu.00g029140.m01.CDS01 [Anthostomella pinea]
MVQLALLRAIPFVALLALPGIQAGDLSIPTKDDAPKLWTEAEHASFISGTHYEILGINPFDKYDLGAERIKLINKAVAVLDSHKKCYYDMKFDGADVAYFMACMNMFDARFDDTLLKNRERLFAIAGHPSREGLGI